MAKRTIISLIDDIDGGKASRTVEFGLDGVSYAIDLSDKNAGELRKVLDPFLAAASRIGRTHRSSRAAAPVRSRRDRNQIIRGWAAHNGYEVAGRGRIPITVVEAFSHRS